MINLCLINHSSDNFERFYTVVNLIKNLIRNLIDIETVSSILQVRSYYDGLESFQITENTMNTIKIM